MKPGDDEAMTSAELRAHLVQKKEARHRQRSALPILEKFRLMEQMRERATAVRALRGTKSC